MDPTNHGWCCPVVFTIEKHLHISELTKFKPKSTVIIWGCQALGPFRVWRVPHLMRRAELASRYRNWECQLTFPASPATKTRHMTQALPIRYTCLTQTLNWKLVRQRSRGVQNQCEPWLAAEAAAVVADSRILEWSCWSYLSGPNPQNSVHWASSTWWIWELILGERPKPSSPPSRRFCELPNILLSIIPFLLI